MKKYLLAGVMTVVMMCVSSAITAQVSGRADRATQIQWSQQFAQIGDLSDAFIASQTMWTDGFYVYVLHSTEGKMYLEPVSMQLLPEKQPQTIELVRKNGKLTEKSSKDVVSHEIIGGWDLLVFRDKNQKTKNTFVSVTEKTASFDKMVERDIHIV